MLAPCGKPRDAPRKCAAATSAATDREGAYAQKAGNSIPAGNRSTFPDQPIVPVAMPPRIQNRLRANLRLEGEDFSRQAENAARRNGSKIS